MVWKPIKSAPKSGTFLVREKFGRGWSYWLSQHDGYLVSGAWHSWHPIPSDEPDVCKECERRRKQTRDRVARVRARKKNDA